MEKITVSYGEINEFTRVAKNYINQKDARPSHLSLALSKSVKLLKPHIDDCDDAKAEKRIDLAKKDSNGVIEIHENGIYKMTPDASKKLQAEFRKIDSTQVEITPYYAKSVPANLELAWYDYFVPFVIKDYPEVAEE